MKRLALAILIVLALFILGLFIGSKQGGNEVASGAVADLTLESHEGGLVSLSDLRGTPLVINTWASWCEFCKEELKDFKLLQEEFGDSVRVIAINRAESLERAQRFTNELGVEGSFLFLLDPDDSFYRSIDGFSMPETIFVDSEGQVSIHKRGFMRIDEMRDKTNQIVENG